MGKEEMARLGHIQQYAAKFPMRTEHFENTHVGGLSNFSACRMTAKKFLAPAAPLVGPKSQFGERRVRKLWGVRRGGGGGRVGHSNKPPTLIFNDEKKCRRL